MQVLTLPINQLRLNDDNPRVLKDARFQQLVKSLQEFPEMLELRPCVVDETYTVLGGNMRLRALQYLGYTEVPVVVAMDLTTKQKREFIIKDNGSFGEWDWDALANGGWPDAGTLNEWGVDVPPDWGVVEELPAAQEGEPNLEPPMEPVTVLGDLYELNGHRVQCADSTDPDAIARLMAGKEADLLFTDPPYGVSAGGGRSQTVEKLGIKAIANDDLRGEPLEQFIRDALALAPIRDNGSFYVCYDQKTQHEFTGVIAELGWRQRTTIIWNKNVFGLSGHKGYRPKFELIAFGHTGETYDWHGGNDQADVWDIARPRERPGNHPTPKPVELVARAIENSSAKGQVVLDLFGGSGSTLLAAEQTSRLCYTQELDPAYVDVHVARWTKYMQGNNCPFTVKRNGVLLGEADLAEFSA